MSSRGRPLECPLSDAPSWWPLHVAAAPVAMLSSTRRVTVCLVAAACLLLTANLRMRSQHAATAAVLQEQRWSALSERLDRAALATPILTSPPPPAAAPSPTPSSPALSSAAPQSDRQPRKDPSEAARCVKGSLSLRACLGQRAAAAKRLAAARAAAAQRAAAEPAKRPAFAPGQAAATQGLALRSGTGQPAVVDTEGGVRQGSRCRDELDKRTLWRPRCINASDIMAELDAEAAREAEAGEAAGRGERAPVSP